MSKPRKKSSKSDNQRGRPSDRLKIDGGWQDAVSKALDKEKPDEGWPNPQDEDEKTEDQNQP